ncbi:prothymosin alpha isoform X1 [Dendrobates tinctorius]|uniref:prothymosin alpha isoform X1 n=1 Tax=Dendrobates tinctorius TaxID=92724 RepID=UPI003CC9B93D
MWAGTRRLQPISGSGTQEKDMGGVRSPEPANSSGASWALSLKWGLQRGASEQGTCNVQDLKARDKEVVEETENGKEKPANGKAENEENGDDGGDNDGDEEEEVDEEDEEDEVEGDDDEGDEDDDAEGPTGKRAADDDDDEDDVDTKKQKTDEDD